MSVAAMLDDYLDGLLAPEPVPRPAPAAVPQAAATTPDADAPAPDPSAGSPAEAHAAEPATAALVEPDPEPMAATPAVATTDPADVLPPAPASDPQAARAEPAASAAATVSAPAPSITAARQLAAEVAAPARVTPPAHVPPAPAPPRAYPAAMSPRIPQAEADGEAPVRRAADRSSRWLRLRCGDQRYGLELLKVQEVVLPVPLLALRGTATAMLGVMNLRGQVVPVLDLGMHLGKPAQPSTASTRFVVLEEKGEVLGLRVSAVEDVVTLGEHQVEPPATTQVRPSSDGLFRGIARQGGDPMVLLDAGCLLSMPARGN